MIEKCKYSSDVPIIVMNGTPEVNFKNLGVTKTIELLFKPIDLDKLKSLLAKYSTKKSKYNL